MLPHGLLDDARAMGRFYGGMLVRDADTAFDRMHQLATGKPAEAHLADQLPTAVRVFDGLTAVASQPDKAEVDADWQAVTLAFRDAFNEAAVQRRGSTAAKAA